MREGERQELEQALRRAARPVPYGDVSKQPTVTIPRALARLMAARSQWWRFVLCDEGVLFVPVAQEDLTLGRRGISATFDGPLDEELPAWAFDAQEPVLVPAGEGGDDDTQ